MKKFQVFIKFPLFSYFCPISQWLIVHIFIQFVVFLLKFLYNFVINLLNFNWFIEVFIQSHFNYFQVLQLLSINYCFSHLKFLIIFSFDH